MIDEFFELRELQAGIRAGVEGLFPEKVRVLAEVSSVQVKSNGHCYVDLCQNDGGILVAKAKAVIWRSRYSVIAGKISDALGGPLCPGMQIMCRVQVNYSELYSLSLVIDDIEPQFTIGAAEMERRRTVARLEAEDLMDRQKSLDVPLLPLRLAVISASGAAGYGDFLRHLEENPYGFRFDVTFIEAVMQGASAPASIADALRLAGEDGDAFDAVLVLRGGGSALDLACFDDYGLAVAIALCPVPVYTAIGHDRDCHVADMVAFKAVKTPTALADEFIAAFAAEDERICGFATRFKLARLNRLSGMESKVESLYAGIIASDPRKVLSRGFVLAVDEAGRVVKNAASLAEGQKMKVLFADGIAEIRVEKLKI